MTDQTKPISPWRGWNKTAHGIQTKGIPCPDSWWTWKGTRAEWYEKAQKRAAEMIRTSDDSGLPGSAGRGGL
jgi:hypothetical protein